MSEYHDWEDIRAELHDGDDAALAAERARIPGDGGFTCSLDVWHPTVQCRNQFLELAPPFRRRQRHGVIPRAGPRRDTFHTSPQPAQRQ